MKITYIHIYLLLLYWGYTKICFPSTQKYSTPTQGIDTKHVLVNISLERLQLQKKRHGLCKSYLEKEKVLEKMNKCSRYLKQWVLRCCLRKRRIKMNKIAHVFLQKFSSFKQGRYVSRSIVELG